MFSETERGRRLNAAQEIMKEEGLSGLLMVGNGAVGTNSYGCFRYLTDNRVYYYLQTAVFAPDKAPVAIATSYISQLEFLNNSFIKDCRVFTDSMVGIMEIFEEMGIKSGKVGTCLEILPTSWMLQLMEKFPQIEWVDVSEAIFRIRNVHSDEEAETIRKCARLADIGYEVVKQKIKPGMSEQQVVAELEYAIQKNGGENNFSLISSGRFSFDDNRLPCIHAATMFDKVIEPGDSVAMEITPRYNGYWTQLVRTLCIGEPSEDFRTLHKVVVETINDALNELRPGNPIGNIAKRIRKFTEDSGYVFSLPCGHICAIDLNEERIDEANMRPLMPGMAVILHPSVITPKLQTGIFWGETFLITESGYEKIMNSNNEIVVI